MVSIGASASGVEVTGAACLIGIVRNSVLGMALEAVMIMVILANVNA